MIASKVFGGWKYSVENRTSKSSALFRTNFSLDRSDLNLQSQGPVYSSMLTSGALSKQGSDAKYIVLKTPRYPFKRQTEISSDAFHLSVEISSNSVRLTPLQPPSLSTWTTSRSLEQTKSLVDAGELQSLQTKPGECPWKAMRETCEGIQSTQNRTRVGTNIQVSLP
jgi:hypothetical protein